LQFFLLVWIQLFWQIAEESSHLIDSVIFDLPDDTFQEVIEHLFIVEILEILIIARGTA